MSAEHKDMDTDTPSTFVTSLVTIAAEAGEAIQEIYRTKFEVSHKRDRSPLTMADQRSHEIITCRLSELSPRFPVLSEEGKNIPFEERKMWEYFWLVDPLDGTKEFIRRNGEFTINIALIHGSKPVVGLIYIPDRLTYYFAVEGGGAYKLVNDNIPVLQLPYADLLGKATRLPVVSRKVQDGIPVTIIGSRSHASQEFDEFTRAIKEKYPDVRILSAGSSLKFCLVAEGAADIYPRFGPTMEWDTAAGQCIVEESGGMVVAMPRKTLAYNKESLQNSAFVVLCCEPLLKDILRFHSQGEEHKEQKAPDRLH